MDDDIRAVLDRPAQVRRRHGVVDHQRYSGLVRDLGNCLDVQYVHPRIGDGFAVQRTRFGGDGLAEVFRIVRLDEFGFDPQPAEADIELRVRAAVERAGRYHFVARSQQAGDRQELRRLSTRRRQARDAAFERRNALLEDIGGRIHDAGVNVAELLQTEQRRGMVGVFKSKGSALVDGHRPRAARRVRRMTGVQGLRGEPEFAGRSVVVSHSYRITRQAALSSDLTPAARDIGPPREHQSVRKIVTPSLIRMVSVPILPARRCARAASRALTNVFNGPAGETTIVCAGRAEMETEIRLS